MNQGKIWLVVKPSVGLPLFLGTVLIIALLVHAFLALKTDWYGSYWNGNKAKAQAAAVAPAGSTTVAVAPAPK
jgi:light-harvesting protein B-800-850 alpha chain